MGNRLRGRGKTPVVGKAPGAHGAPVMVGGISGGPCAQAQLSRAAQCGDRALDGQPGALGSSPGPACDADAGESVLSTLWASAASFNRPWSRCRQFPFLIPTPERLPGAQREGPEAALRLRRKAVAAEEPCPQWAPGAGFGRARQGLATPQPCPAASAHPSPPFTGPSFWTRTPTPG